MDDAKAQADRSRPLQAPRRPKPSGEPDQGERIDAKAIRRQRKHIEELTGEDPLRGGIAD